MKIKNVDNLLIIYLYEKFFKLDNQDEIRDEIKKLLTRLINVYKFNLSGILEVIIYDNKYYGSILEIRNVKDFEYSDFFDIKLQIKSDIDFYLVVNDYFFIKECKEIFCKNDLFYVNIRWIEDVNKKIEFGEIIHKNDFDDCIIL